jgi:hypothetical protein
MHWILNYVKQTSALVDSASTKGKPDKSIINFLTENEGNLLSKIS